MAKALTDEELNLRRKARRRLIGAIALTLAVVVILPMVLESEPRSTTQDIELQIPDPGQAGEFVPNVAMPALPEPPAVPEPPVVESVPALAPASTVPQADTAKPAAAPAQAAPTAKAEAVSGFVVQVGAYANADTARKELAQLKEWGFRAAFIEKAGDKTRVRVGPYAEREKAEAVVKMLEKHGLHPGIVSLK